MTSDHYGVVTPAPGCYGDVAVIRRVIGAGETIRLSPREALHRIWTGPLGTSEFEWAAGDCVGGGLGRPDAVGGTHVV